MLSLLKDAQCLLTVDTGSVHLAAAVGCTVFGVFNGSQYGRFAPYPKEVADNVYAIYPDEVEQELKDPELVKQKYEFVVSVPYDSVKPEKMILAIHQHYSEKSRVHGPLTMDFTNFPIPTFSSTQTTICQRSLQKMMQHFQTGLPKH
jgi:hypothetical protein